MALGPVQLLLVGFDHPDLRDAIIDVLDRLRASDSVLVIDTLGVSKDAQGAIEVRQLCDQAPGRLVGALVGLRFQREEGLELAAVEAGVDRFSDDDGWDVLGDIPNDTAAALVLIEHRWAVPLREAITRSGGFRIGDGFINPLDLVEIGLATAEEADALSAIETGGFTRPA